MASDKLGVTGTNTKQLPGRRQGLVSRIALDDGTRIAITVVVR